MKLFKNIKKWFENQEHLFYLFLIILIMPNIVLCFTEPLPLMAKVSNVLLPLACYYLLMTLSRNCGKMLWILFIFLFFGAFQIVLLYLFGQSIIAVDMFLNLVTTNSSEAMELLDNLLPAIVTVVILYIPALILGMISIIRKRRLSVAFIRRERKRAFILLGISLLTLGGAYWEDSRYELKSDLYPLNVCYNVGLAFQRTALTQNYHHTSKDFTFHAQATHPADKREVYVMVVGETSRALNWQLYGYERETNPLLSRQPGIVAFSKVLTESNTTHKSVPMLMSDITACNFDSIYHQKGIITAFKEAGYQTAFFVLHTYGSHFNYRERYPSEDAFFLPDYPVEAEVKYRDNLVNAYDNTIRYTDSFLSRLIHMLEEQHVDAAMLYTSDHGEDIFDDSRHLFLHASPVPSYYQLHVPFLIWMSDTYREAYPEHWQTVTGNKDKDVSSSCSFFPTMLELGGVQTSYRNDSSSVVSPLYTMKPRVYLNDHNEPRPLDDLGMKQPDFQKCQVLGIKY